MSKKSKKVSYPSYSGGSVRINGTDIASVDKSGNKIHSNYNMSDAEARMYNSLQNNMASSMENLFSISDNERKQWQNELDALQKQGIQNINNSYTPMERNLKNDIASRFGNLDNSIFLNNLKNITNNKAQAVATLSDNLAAKQSNLYTQEIQNRMNLLNLLNGINSSINNRIIQYLNIANGNAASGSQYNQNAYNAAQNQSSNGMDWLNAAINAGIGGLKLFI